MLEIFGAKIKKVPLNPIEAHIAYQSRYVPKAKYPFLITLFTTTQLNEIKKQCATFWQKWGLTGMHQG